MAEAHKRSEIARCEERMDYFLNLISQIELSIEEFRKRVAERQERINDLRSRVEYLERQLPRLSTVDRFITRRVIESLKRTISALAGWQTRQRRTLRRYAIWFYWFHWWRVRRAEWQTHLWFQTLKVLKDEAERGVTVERADIIRTQLNTIEEGIEGILTEIRETERIAKEREWRIRWPAPYPTMARWISSIYGRLSPIRKLIREIRELLIPPPKKVLVRIKIRLYNESREATPTGQFQTFFDIDAIVEPIVEADTEIVNWEWWLTEEEISIAKYHMIGYFKGMGKWREPEQMTLAYFTDPSGIPSRSDIAAYGRSHKNVPAEFIRKASDLTIEELIVGISSVEPEPNLEPTAENMGVFFERALIIKNDMIVWDEVRNKWVWHPTNSMIERVKKELKLR